MNSKMNGKTEKEKLLEILGVDKGIPDEEINSHYKKIRLEQKEKMLNEQNYRERAKLQNLVIAIDDAYFEYKDSLKKCL